MFKKIIAYILRLFNYHPISSASKSKKQAQLVDDIQLSQSLHRLKIRRQILDWRDVHILNIDQHLRKNIEELFNNLDKEIDNKASKIDFFIKIKKYMEENINPIYDQWIENESEWLLQNAQNDLSTIYNTIIESNKNSPRHADIHNKNSINTTTAAISIGATTLTAGGATIISTMAVTPAWGILGMIGLTAISWPIAIAGGGLIVLGGFIGNEAFKKHINDFKEQIKKEACMKVLGCENCKTSVQMVLEDRIFETAKNILSEHSI